LNKKQQWLDWELGDGRTYVCNDRFSIADITGMAALFVSDFPEILLPNNLMHLDLWVSAVRSHDV